MNPTRNPASNTGSPNGYPTSAVQNLSTQSPSTQVQGTNRLGAQNAGARSLPALLIPEDYRARAVALHAWTGPGAPEDYRLLVPGGEIGVHVGADPLGEDGSVLLTGPATITARITVA